MTRIKKSLISKRTLKNKVCFFYFLAVFLFGSLLATKADAYYNNEFIPYCDNVNFQVIYSPQITVREFNLTQSLPAMSFADFQPQSNNNYFIYDSYDLDKYINHIKAYIDSLGVYKINKPINRNSLGYFEENNPEEKLNLNNKYLLLLKQADQGSSEQHSVKE